MGEVVPFRLMAGEYVFVDTEDCDPFAARRRPVWSVEWVDANGVVYPVAQDLTYFEASTVAHDIGSARKCGFVCRREA